MSEVSVSTELSRNADDEEPRKEGCEDIVASGDDDADQAFANNDVQRAIEGLADIPDEELQEFFNDEDFMEGLDVVDAWVGDVDKTTKPSRGDSNRDREHAKSSREHPRRDRKSQNSRDRARRDDRRREDARRDPSKSSKDIERDKMRTKKDTASKILAEKEKAIKHLLDSDNVVPPGTEVEAIQKITDKQHNPERTPPARTRKSRERRGNSPPRRRSSDRIRLSPNRRNSGERRQIRISPGRRRGAASPPLRRSWERRASRDRSLERHRRREERELRHAARRSRSRDRPRSRSPERYRKRWSRSPTGRRTSPRRHSRSRSPERRARKRSPFINEIARQFGTKNLIPGGAQSAFLPGIPPLMGAAFPHDQVAPVPPVPPPPLLQQFMHHPGAPRPSGILMPGQGGAAPFVNFEVGQPMSYEPGRGPLLQQPPSDYASGPIMYGQGNPGKQMQPPMLSMPSPQPVPAPVPNDHHSSGFGENRRPPSMEMHHKRGESTSRRSKSPNSSRNRYSDLKKALSSYNGAEGSRTDREPTPEPPIISNSKHFEKTSLSSLLEASVSAKETFGLPVLYPGFKPEILRQCELALRELPAEDLRLKMKGRFFYDPSKEHQQPEAETSGSNSILLKTGRGLINWEAQGNASNSFGATRPSVQTRQKICQTDEIEMDCKAIQAVLLTKTADFSHQVYPNDLQQTAKEEKRTIMDRLDWNVQEAYDYAPTIREADDLRWSLSNSSQKRNSWNRGISPTIVIEEDRRHGSSPLMAVDTRGMNVASTARVRDDFSFDRSSSRELFSRERFSPTYRGSVERQEDYRESRSNHSRGESPMALEESMDEVEVIDSEHYQRAPDRRSRSNANFGPTSALQKLRALRGKTSGRTFQGRGGFRGKF